MLMFGIVSEVDAGKGLARVKFEDRDIASDWLPVSVRNSLDNKYECPLDVNERVWCLMDDQSENGIIGGAIYDANNAPSVGNADTWAITFKDGTKITYDRASSKMVIDCVGDVEVKCVNATVEASAKVTIDSPVAEFTGNVEVAGSVIADGNVTATATTLPIALSTHKHTGVVPGPGSTGTPIP